MGKLRLGDMAEIRQRLDANDLRLLEPRLRGHEDMMRHIRDVQHHEETRHRGEELRLREESLRREEERMRKERERAEERKRERRSFEELPDEYFATLVHARKATDDDNHILERRNPPMSARTRCGDQQDIGDGCQCDCQPLDDDALDGLLR